MKSRRFDWHARAIQVGFVFALLLFWYYLGRSGAVSAIFLPQLPRVAEKFIQIVQSASFYNNLAVTLFELIVAVAIASLFGLTIGYLIGRSRYAVLVFEPLLAGIFAVPIIVFLPLFMLFFGIDIESKIAFGATYAFFPIVLNTIGGISQVDPRFITVSRSMGANEQQLFRRVLLPAALPVIVTGLRIGATIGFLAILGSEMIAGLRGLGSRVANLAEGMNTAEMFAYIVFVIILAGILNLALSTLQRRFAGPRSAASATRSFPAHELGRSQALARSCIAIPRLPGWGSSLWLSSCGKWPDIRCSTRIFSARRRRSLRQCRASSAIRGSATRSPHPSWSL